MKVLHLGAFRGNSGDLFSHYAFQSMFRSNIDVDATFTKVELREFYRNARLRDFDDRFLDEINRHDLFIIGGGQFFDARWNYSYTGTTLNFSPQFLEMIRCPVIVNGVGYAEPRANMLPPEEMAEIFDKFKWFLETVSKKEWLLTLRNDGSYGRIEQRFGRELADLFSVVPDNGFYFGHDVMPYRFDDFCPTVGLNIANDQFKEAGDSGAFIDLLNADMAAVIDSLITQGTRIILLPHMPRDLDVIHKLYCLLGEKAFRFNVCVAPYNPQDENAARQLVSYYKACDVVVTMRFHANVISIANSIPSVGLAVEGIVSDERIRALYDDVGLSKFCMPIGHNNHNTAQTVLEKIEQTKSCRREYKERSKVAMDRIEKMRRAYIQNIKKYLQHKKRIMRI